MCFAHPPHPYRDYLFMNLLIGPYFPPEVAANSSDGGGSGARRRLAAWVGEAVSLRDAGAGGLPAGTLPLVAAEAQGELVQRVKTLLSKPKFTLARRHPKGHRRLLTAPPEEEPANKATGEVPQLKVGWGEPVPGRHFRASTVFLLADQRGCSACCS